MDLISGLPTPCLATIVYYAGVSAIDLSLCSKRLCHRINSQDLLTIVGGRLKSGYRFFEIG
jgi:MFS superfamily sulfate permease-like transporter